MFKKFIFLNKFSEKLGLQALLGKELKFLLLGMFNKSKQSKKSSVVGIILYIISIVTLNFSLFWGLNKENSIDFLGEFTDLALFPNSATLITISIIINILSVVIPLWLFLTKNEKKRALLVVDDLDRVTPDEMLDIIESLKLFLEDEEIGQVLQIVMIFEESAFKTALSNKYARLINEKNNSDNCKDHFERIFNENMQKLFIAHLTLPPLSQSECIEYSSSLLDYTLSENEENNTIFEKTNLKLKNLTLKPLEVQKPLSKLQSTSEVPISTETKPEELTNYEKKAIINSLKYFDITGKPVMNIGPRAIQSFVFKYKLGRKLLEARGHHQLNPELLANLIAKRISNKKIDLEIAGNLNIDVAVLDAVLNEISLN